MPNIHEKRALLRALQSGPDFLGLAALPLIQAKEGRELLRWLDQSGLALSFLRRISARGEGADIPSEWRDALERRRERNAIRMLDMLEEFRRLNEAFRAQGILTVTLKGFSLVPDFCEDPCDRHQTDFDLLVEPANVEGAAEVLQSLGYSTARLSRSEESCFTTPLRHIPSYKDDLYAVQHHRQVDLHVSLSESSSWTELDVPGDCMLHAEPLTLCGVNFHAVSLADRFLGQVLHAFRHSFRSWIRLSWLMEIGRCMDLHGENEDFVGAGGRASRRPSAVKARLCIRFVPDQSPFPISNSLAAPLLGRRRHDAIHARMAGSLFCALGNRRLAGKSRQLVFGA